MRKIKSLLSIALVIVMLFSLVSCEKNVEENEAKELVKNLVSESCKLNEILYGEGLPYEENTSENKYAPVSIDAEYKTLFSLKEKIRGVFTSSYSNSLIEYIFSYTPGVYGGGTYPRYEEQGGWLVVLKDYNVREITEYDYDTIEIKKIKRKEIKATIKSTENETVEIVLIKEADGWRLDSATV